jgi:hypothetical protein
MKRTLPALFFVTALVALSAFPAAAARSRSAVTGGPRGAYPYLFKEASRKNLLDRHPWSILHQRPASVDTLHIAAFRVEFELDTSELTTGTGKFGIFKDGSSSSDQEEKRYYQNGVYPYDNTSTEHNKNYFADQLDFVKTYFTTVSRGRLHIDYTIYPSGEYDAYQVPHHMTTYSPGARQPEETWDQYYERRTVALMRFIKDALQAADEADESPFTGLWIDSTTADKPIVRDSLGRKTALMLIHAGASYLTDGGHEGYLGQDSPSDMIDAFIAPDFFEYYREKLEFDTLMVRGDKHTGMHLNDKALFVDEVMMVSETSNQDSLNWGIHGILVNQLARQIGIPDLFSTMSGISGVGAFCIMDFAGYSAGYGFIPPWPSAWVRAFMGWDTPVVADIAAGHTYDLTAVSAAGDGDTTILLVPINDHEYYLIENRQRNLSGTDSLFNYETTDGIKHIDLYDRVNLDANIDSTSGNGSVIMKVKNFDVGLPASGVLIWHVDEERVRDRLGWNILNADSLYRAVSLEEADGIQDLGIEFEDMFYQAAFDYGGAQDVFPHKRRGAKDKDIIRTMGPFTRPATHSNDGGHTYLKITVEKPGAKVGREINAVRDYYVVNYSDSVIGVTVELDPPVAETRWQRPRPIVPDSYYEPTLCDVAGDDARDVALLDTSGRLYVWDLVDGTLRDSSYGELIDSVLMITMRGDSATRLDSTAIDTLIVDPDTGDTTRTVYRFDTAGTYLPVRYLARIDSPFTFPTTVDGRLYVPAGSVIHVVGKGGDDTPVSDTIPTGMRLSSYVCNYRRDRWAVGCADGSVLLGRGTTVTDTIAGGTNRRAPVQALAVMDSLEGIVATVDTAGLVSVVGPDGVRDTLRLKKGIAPYTLAAADLNRCDGITAVDIVVCDGRQGLWLLSTAKGLEPAEGWRLTPNDWAAYYSYVEDTSDTRRVLLPRNPSAPSLADLDGDGALDIVVGGANGVYAVSARGALLTNAWPAYLDNRYWYQRGTITSTPTVATAPDGGPLVLFATPTGENVTIAVGDIDSTNTANDKVYYTTSDGHSDSIADLDPGYIDTLLVFGDSVIFPYVLPGGFIDARDRSGERPVFQTISLPNVGKVSHSYWPLTVGGSAVTAPLLCDMDGDGHTDILAVSAKGWLYRWELGSKALSGPMHWPQTGFDEARSFAYRGPDPGCPRSRRKEVVEFYSYPNPTNAADAVTFRYELSAKASMVRLDVFTYTGYHVYSAANLSGAFPGPNEHVVPVRDFGPAVYRCRLEATFGNTSDVRYWKMAVVR